MAVCHEVTDAVVERMQEYPSSLLVAYHPLLFSPTRRVVAGTGPVGRAFRLLKAGVALAIVHTAFDVVPNGTAAALAEALGLAKVRGFGMAEPASSIKVVAYVPESAVDSVRKAMTDAGGGQIGPRSGCSFRCDGIVSFIAESGAEEPRSEVRLEMVAPAGSRDAVVSALAAAHPAMDPVFDVSEVVSSARFIGRVGTLSAETPIDDFAARVSTALGVESIRTSSRRPTVRTVAVIPGSGASMIDSAVAVGADVLVTGDVSHHRVVGALDRGMAVVDPGHIPSERPGVRRLAAVIGGITEVIDLSDLDPNPWG